MHEFCVFERDIDYLSLKYNVTVEALNRELVYEFSEGKARIEIEQQIRDHKTIARAMETNAQLGDPRCAQVWRDYMATIRELTSAKQLIVAHYESDILRAAKRIQA